VSRWSLVHQIDAVQLCSARSAPQSQQTTSVYEVVDQYQVQALITLCRCYYAYSWMHSPHGCSTYPIIGWRFRACSEFGVGATCAGVLQKACTFRTHVKAAHW